jgi:hypothetical protein
MVRKEEVSLLAFDGMVLKEGVSLGTDGRMLLKE